MGTNTNANWLDSQVEADLTRWGQKGEYSIHALLEDYFLQKRWSNKAKLTFYERLGKYLLYPYGELISQLQSTILSSEVLAQIRNRVPEGSPENSEPKKKRPIGTLRTKLEYARAAVLCGIPYSVFGLERADVFPQEESKFFQFAFSNNMEIGKQYLNFMNTPLEYSMDWMQVFDYLGRGYEEIPVDNLDGYLNAWKEIFDQIETRIRHGMKYTRILGLDIKNGVKDTFLAVSEAVIERCSPELFQHVCTCLNEFGDDEVQLFITNQSTRAYQFAILKKPDQDALLYEESYAFDRKGNAYPSFATILQEAANRERYSIYANEVKRFIRDNIDMMYTRENFIDSFELYQERFLKQSLEKYPEVLSGASTLIRKQKLKMFEQKSKIFNHTFNRGL